jgi:hypothetical protein
MSREKIPTAAKFRDRFVQSYDEVRQAFRTTTEWSLKGWPQWTGLMLAHPSSVLAKAAQKLGLHYYDGEPLRLDAVFSADDGAWFPVVAAIEHENVRKDFVKSEVAKLLTIRCPLKVGITHVGRSGG